MNSHRDNFLDSLEGKRVKIWFKDGDILTGNLMFDADFGKYRLKNTYNIKKGFMQHDIVFRKTHIKKLEVSHG